MPVRCGQRLQRLPEICKALRIAARRLLKMTFKVPLKV